MENRPQYLSVLNPTKTGLTTAWRTTSGFWIALMPQERVCALVRAFVLKTLVKRDN